MDEDTDDLLHEGDCRTILPTLPAESFDSVMTDPPYEINFMSKTWDGTGVAFDVDVWKAALRVLKPGGYMLAFGGTRTHHRIMCAIEDAGFEIRDCLMWLYGTGMPKGQGCLKPAWEPIVLARKPGRRVLPLGIDACRVGTTRSVPHGRTSNSRGKYGAYTGDRDEVEAHRTDIGRYPANVCHDGSEEVMEAFAAFGETPRGGRSTRPSGWGGRTTGKFKPMPAFLGAVKDTGTAARFFYCAKASKSERGTDNTHPTVKPLSLVRWLVRLVTPPGGLVLDPFAGSGTTILAAQAEGMRAVGIEQDVGHCAIIRKRLVAAAKTDGLFAEVA